MILSHFLFVTSLQPDGSLAYTLQPKVESPVPRPKVSILRQSQKPKVAHFASTKSFTFLKVILPKPLPTSVAQFASMGGYTLVGRPGFPGWIALKNNLQPCNGDDRRPETKQQASQDRASHRRQHSQQRCQQEQPDCQSEQPKCQPSNHRQPTQAQHPDFLQLRYGSQFHSRRSSNATHRGDLWTSWRG